jgi:hypothetical protein
MKKGCSVMTIKKQSNETSQTPTERMDTVTLTLEEWESWRRAAGLHIDPETAEVHWAYTQVVDPYGLWPEIPEECDCVGRSYFVRSPGMGVWIEFGDLPDATRGALWEKHKDRLAFPAGLEPVFFAQQYLEQNFGSTGNLSEDEALEALIVGYQAYLDDKNKKARLHEDGRDDRDDGALS